MKECPYCHKDFKNSGIAIHIGRCKKNPKRITNDIRVDEQSMNQGSGQGSDSIEIQDTPPATHPDPAQEKCVETPILHRTPPENTAQQEAITPDQSSFSVLPAVNPDSPFERKISLLRLKEQKEKQRKADKLLALHNKNEAKRNAKAERKALKHRPKEDSTIVEPEADELDKEAEEPKAKKVKGDRAPMRNAESVLNWVLSIPIWLLLITIGLNVNPIIELSNNPYMELIVFVIQNPNDQGSQIVLALMAIMVTLVLLVVHRLFWRMAFKDLILKDFRIVGLARQENKDDTKVINSKAIKTFMPSTKQGRIYLSIGAGKWDKMYRKLFHVPYPDTITLYVKRSRFKPVNPFKPLASCDILKVYNPERLEDPDKTRYQNDGRWRRIVQGNRLIRDFTDNSLEYWVDSGFYPQPNWNAKWYEKIHEGVLDKGLRKVTKGCQINSDIQQDQLRNNVLHIPVQEIEAERQFKDFKEKGR
jgi:hypothetical protein